MRSRAGHSAGPRARGEQILQNHGLPRVLKIVPIECMNDDKSKAKKYVDCKKMSKNSQMSCMRLPRIGTPPPTSLSRRVCPGHFSSAWVMLLSVVKSEIIRHQLGHEKNQAIHKATAKICLSGSSGRAPPHLFYLSYRGAQKGGQQVQILFVDLDSAWAGGIWQLAIGQDSGTARSNSIQAGP